MHVDLRTLQPNPMRDFTIDPIDADTIAALQASITDYGFWGGVACRQLEDGTLQIAAGHHRIAAAIGAGITYADVYVQHDITDAEMVRIYGTENATQRGNTSTALAGTVASALRFCIKELFLGRYPFALRPEDQEEDEVSQICDTSKLLAHTKSALLSDAGIGERVLWAFLKDIPGITRPAIRQQLANLKASGDYARLIRNVEQELEDERQRALAAAEAAERERERRLQEELAAQAKRLEAELRAKEAAAAAKAAREEEERRRQERRAQDAEVARQRAEAEARLAQQQRQEAEAKRAEFEAMRQHKEEAHTAATAVAAKAATRPKTFDFEGVAQHLKNAYQLQTFREVVQSPGIRPYLPVDKQADLARHLVHLAQDKRLELTAAFIREQVTTILLGEKDVARAEDRSAREALQREDILRRAEHYQDEFCRFAYSMATAGDKLAKLCDAWPAEVKFPLQPRFVKTFQNVRSILERISASLPKL